jgi:endoglucanase
VLLQFLVLPARLINELELLKACLKGTKSIEQYEELGQDCIKSKALDDRVGCAVILEVLKERYSFDLYACFTVQEEIGMRGAEVAAYSINPDLGLVLEGTTCSDVPGVDKHWFSTCLGGGAALSIMDSGHYPDKYLVNYIYRLAQKHGIPVQFRQTTTAANDAGKIQSIINQSRSGC